MDRNYPTTELWRVLAGLAPGRRDARQITLFDSVGFAIAEFSALQHVRERVAETGFCERLDMIADPDDPRDLFGMLERASNCSPDPRAQSLFAELTLARPTLRACQQRVIVSRSASGNSSASTALTSSGRAGLLSWLSRLLNLWFRPRM
jgi:hypothetical protein